MFPDRFQACALSSIHSSCGHGALTHLVNHTKRKQNFGLPIHSGSHFSVLEPITEVPNSKLSNHTISRLVLTINPFPPRTTKPIGTILMLHIPQRKDKQCTSQCMDRKKRHVTILLGMLPIKAGCFEQNFWPKMIIKMFTCHYENLDLPSWKSRPAIMKISIVHDKI